MAIYLLAGGRRCPALFTSGVHPDGSPQRAVYWYVSTEAPSAAPEQQFSSSLIAVPDDDGASWTATNHPTGANLYVIASDDTPLQAVSDRLRRASENLTRAKAGEPAAAEQAVEGPTEQPAASLPLWQRLGFASKEAWKAKGKPDK